MGRNRYRVPWEHQGGIGAGHSGKMGTCQGKKKEKVHSKLRLWGIEERLEKGHRW